MLATTNRAGLLRGDCDIDTFLYPYDFVAPRVGEIAAWIQRWQAHSLNGFIYALRKLVDGEPGNPVSKAVLLQLRELDFEYLSMLVQSTSAKDESVYSSCMQRRFDLIWLLMKAVSEGKMADPNGFLAGALQTVDGGY